ncbi:unnamed protein product [Lathyrus oleraceus]
MYPDHTSRHIWDKEDRDPLKFINHGRKTIGLPRPNEDWFQVVLSLSGLKDLCMTNYITVNHEMFNAVMERLNSKTSSFHLPLDDMLCLLHLSIRRRLLDHERISKDEALKMMVDYLGVDPGESMNELDMTMEAHVRFEYLKKVYTYELRRAHQTTCDEEQVGLHRGHALRAYLLYLVGTMIFMDKSASYTYVVYLRYFQDFERIH